jgi:hypothetical protein
VYTSWICYSFFIFWKCNTWLTRVTCLIYNFPEHFLYQQNLLWFTDKPIQCQSSTSMSYTVLQLIRFLGKESKNAPEKRRPPFFSNCVWFFQTEEMGCLALFCSVGHDCPIYVITISSHVIFSAKFLCKETIKRRKTQEKIYDLLYLCCAIQVSWRWRDKRGSKGNVCVCVCVREEMKWNAQNGFPFACGFRLTILGGLAPGTWSRLAITLAYKGKENESESWSPR